MVSLVPSGPWRRVPTPSATLLLAFMLGSLARYRPTLAANLAESRLSLPLDAFVNEADGYALPAFRNLLYREELTVTRSQGL